MNPISNVATSTNLSTAFNSGRAAVATSSQQLNRDAQQISNPDGANVTNALLDSTQSLSLAQAGANIIRASNQMLGTLLDIFA